MNQLHARSWLSIHIYFWTLLYGLKSYSTSVWQVILTPAVLLSLTTLGQCSAGPTGLALPQRADSMTSADLWSFICHICGSRWPNGFCVYASPFTQRSSCTQSHTIWVIVKALLIGGNGIRWVGVLVKWKAMIGGRSEWGCWVKLGDESCWMLFMTSHGGLKINASE